MYLHKIDMHKIDIIIMHGMALNSRHVRTYGVLNLPSLHQSATIRNDLYGHQIYIPMLYNLSKSHMFPIAKSFSFPGPEDRLRLI